MPQKTLIVVAGPTAIGKTDMAIRLAQHFQTAIISADSRQFYREMSIGTAKPTPAELSLAPHYFIDSASITDNFSVGDFEEEGLRVLAECFSHHDLVLLTGGSGLYINAICRGFDALPEVPKSIREELNNLYAEQGIAPLQQQLSVADPAYYSQVDKNNPQRLIRALEVWRATGRPFSSYHSQKPRERTFSSIKIALNTSRDVLYDRINRRVDAMMSAGLLNEVKSLLPYRHLNALNTVGYSELFSYLDGELTLDEAVELIKQNTRRFAKRQLTWFRKDPDMHWFEPDQYQEILAHIREKPGTRLVR